MPRAAYRLTAADRFRAVAWIEGQIRGQRLPVSAASSWAGLDRQDTDAVWAWVEAHLSADELRRMRGAVRSARHATGTARYSRTITIGEDAHRMLARVALHRGLTLSETIVALARDAYEAVLLEAEPEAAAWWAKGAAEPRMDIPPGDRKEHE